MPRYGNALVFTVLAAIAAASSDKADLFSYSGGIVTFDVTVTGIYEITVAGASGGGGFRGTSGGLGALVSGDILLNAGTVLDIAVGGEGHLGGNDAGGGGGGSFVVGSGNVPLAVAGGGGGGGD